MVARNTFESKAGFFAMTDALAAFDTTITAAAACGKTPAQPPMTARSISKLHGSRYGSVPKPSFFLRICLGKMRGETHPEQFVAFTRSPYETWPIAYRNVPPIGLDHVRAFQFADQIVIAGRCTPNISASRLWVMGRASSSLRSRIMSSQRASRCLRLWAPWHAADTSTCSKKACA
jgi:hypothetical protein